MAREVIDIIIQERGGRQVSRNIDRIGSSSTRSAGGVQLLRNALRGLGAGFAIREVLRAVDSYQRMQNQLRVVGLATDQLRDAQRKLFDIAQRTRVPLEATVSLYGKLAQSAGELGKSQAEMMRFTELTGKALAIQGTGTNGARSALLQLSQAMGEGIVRAQEYNSLIENARPLLVAAAAGMDKAGGSVARLRTMVLNGEVTSREFFDAVIKGGKILDEQFGNTLPTIGQGLTKLRNAFTQFMGESAAGQLILSVVAGTLIFIADNFVDIATYATIAGVAFATYWGVSVMARAVTGITGAVRAQMALNVALGATGFSAGVAAASLKFVTAGVRTLTVAIAANPLGLLLVALIAVLAGLFAMRDAMVTVGTQTASVGSIVQVVWSDAKTAVSSFVTNASNWVGDLMATISTWFASLGLDGKAMANFLIAAVKSFVDIGIGQFKLFFEIAKAVFQGISNVGSGVFDGLAFAIKGEFSLARDAFKGAFSKDNFDAAGIIATAKKTAARVADNFSTDFIGGVADGLKAGTAFLAASFEETMIRAIKLDNAPKIQVQEFEFIKPPPAPDLPGAKIKLTDLQKRLKEIIEETAVATNKATIEQIALGVAYKNGFITAEQYAVRLQDVRLFQAEAALEGQNLAGAIRDTNQAILELKVESGTGTFADGFLLGLSRMSEGAVNFTANTGALFSDFFTSFSEGFSNSIGRAIVQSDDLGDALHNVASEALTALLSGLIKLGIQYVINAAIGKTVGAATTAAGVVQASVTAAAWAPAAALVSLASFGANAVPANAAIAATLASTKALSIIGAFADGGIINAPGGPRDDRGLAAVSDGEFIVNARDTARNRPLLEALNQGFNVTSRMAGFALGGATDNKQPNRVRPVSRSTKTNNGVGVQLNVLVQNFTNAEIEVKQINDTDVVVIARKVAKEEVAKGAPTAVAASLADPNSQVSQSLARNTNSQRKR